LGPGSRAELRDESSARKREILVRMFSMKR